MAATVGLVTKRVSDMAVFADRKVWFHGFGTTSSSCLCGSTGASSACCFGLGSFSTKSTGIHTSRVNVGHRLHSGASSTNVYQTAFPYLNSAVKLHTLST